MRLFIKSMANTWPALFASSPVNRPIPDPSSTIDLPLMGGSKDRICHGKHRSQIFRFVVHSLNYAWCSVSAIGRPGQGSRRMSMENINSESRDIWTERAYYLGSLFLVKLGSLGIEHHRLYARYDRMLLPVVQLQRPLICKRPSQSVSKTGYMSC